jgi:hypothetical protein
MSEQPCPTDIIDGPISWLDVKENTKCTNDGCINKLITPVAKSILFKQYTFCSAKCAEHYLQKSYRKHLGTTK